MVEKTWLRSFSWDHLAQ